LISHVTTALGSLTVLGQGIR